MTERFLKQQRRKKSIRLHILFHFGLSFLIGFLITFTVSNVVFLINKEVFELYMPYLMSPLFILTFILSFFALTRRMVKDLGVLERGLEIISEGDLNYRVPVVRKDELGRVAFNINLMAERLQQQIVKERELESSKMEMITGISHDLRTPLTSIIGYIELLRTNSFRNEEEYTRFVQNTYNKAVHLKKMLDDLFEYTRLTSVGDSPVITVMDSEKMARAIDNLLMNALKYSVRPGTVRVVLKSNLKEIHIEIENEGTPLTKEQQDKLFDRFYKVDHSRSSEGIQTGSGLGLSIAKNIIELHGGTLTLHHTNNLFKFTLTLPLEGAPASANPVWDP